MPSSLLGQFNFALDSISIINQIIASFPDQTQIIRVTSPQILSGQGIQLDVGLGNVEGISQFLLYNDGPCAASVGLQNAERFKMAPKAFVYVSGQNIARNISHAVLGGLNGSQTNVDVINVDAVTDFGGESTSIIVVAALNDY